MGYVSMGAIKLIAMQERSIKNNRVNGLYMLKWWRLNKRLIPKFPLPGEISGEHSAAEGGNTCDWKECFCLRKGRAHDRDLCGNASNIRSLNEECALSMYHGSEIWRSAIFASNRESKRMLLDHSWDQIWVRNGKKKMFIIDIYRKRYIIKIAYAVNVKKGSPVFETDIVENGSQKWEELLEKLSIMRGEEQCRGRGNAGRFAVFLP